MFWSKRQFRLAENLKLNFILAVLGGFVSF